jgi:hypothetical protein
MMMMMNEEWNEAFYSCDAPRGSTYHPVSLRGRLELGWAICSDFAGMGLSGHFQQGSIFHGEIASRGFIGGVNDRGWT